jgi:carbonic anhydrase
MDLLQFHFHSPSEHTFNGKNYDLEVHFVSKDYLTDSLSVTGVFFDMAAGGATTSAFLDQWSLTPGANTRTTNVAVQTLVNSLKKSDAYHYKGSLTTPPCHEIVQWYLINDPQPISQAQLSAFNERYQSKLSFAQGRGNNRIIQGLNGRTVYYNVASSAVQLLSIAAASLSAVLFL